jgi:glycosyltransferase involved in cell wall biosynthesis
MQYLQLMYTYAPAWGFGGPNRMMYDYARWMAQDGAGSLVIAGDVHHDYTGIAISAEILDGVSIRRVRVFWRNLVRKSWNFVSPTMLTLALRQIARSGGITVLHVAELRSPVFLYAVILRRIHPAKVRLVYSAFGGLYSKASSRRKWYDAIFMRSMLKAIDVGLAQNEHEVQTYMDHFERYRVVPKPIELLPLHNCLRNADHEHDESDAAQKLLGHRAELGIPLEATVCIFLGRLHPEKGIIRAIDAFLEFEKTLGRPALFLIVGRDDGFQMEISRHIQRSMAQNIVRIVNNVYGARFDYYSLSDMFLGFPTIYEETMLSAVEALGCGTPVLVSREADMPFVQEGGAGFVIDFSIEQALVHMTAIASDLPGFRRRARLVSQKHYSEESARNRFRKMVHDLGDTTATEIRKP